jgi:putative transposase
MSRKRYTPEEIIGTLREAEVRLPQGETVSVSSENRSFSGILQWRRRFVPVMIPTH